MRFGIDIYDQPDPKNIEIWEVEQEIKMFMLFDTTLYINTLKTNKQIVFEGVLSFDFGESLCVSFKDSTVLYSFHLEPIHSSSLVMQKVVAGTKHFIAIDQLGRTFVWGSNLHGQLGITDMNASDWTLNQTLEGLKVVDIAAGDLFSLYLTESGVVYSCGSNVYGQLGKPLDGFEQISQNIPRPVFESPMGSTMQLAAGSRHSVILADNKVYGSGWSKYGQLGEKINQINGFNQIFHNFLVSKVHAKNWETILEIL